METHKSLHICTDKGDWMLYPWLPSHVICIIFITKAFLFFFFFFSPAPPANMIQIQSYMWGNWNQTGSVTCGEVHFNVTWTQTRVDLFLTGVQISRVVSVCSVWQQMWTEVMMTDRRELFFTCTGDQILELNLGSAQAQKQALSEIGCRAEDCDYSQSPWFHLLHLNHDDRSAEQECKSAATLAAVWCYVTANMLTMTVRRHAHHVPKTQSTSQQDKSNRREIK